MYTVNLVTEVSGKMMTQTLGRFTLRKEAFDVARTAAGSDAEYVQRAGDLGRPGHRRVDRGYCNNASGRIAWVIE